MTLKAYKKVYLSVSWIIGITLFVACSHTQENSKDTKELIGQTITVDKDLISDASIVYVDSADVFVRHTQSSPLLSRFKISGDTLLKKGDLISIGNGPNEVHSLLVNSISPKENLLEFYDPGLRKLLVYNSETDSLYEDHSFAASCNNILIFRFAKGLDSGILVSFVDLKNSDSDAIIGLISKEDSTLKPLEGIGGDFMRNLNVQGKMHFAPNSSIYIQPEGKKCLFLSNTGQYGEIFEIENNSIINKKTVIDIVPDFTLNDRGQITNAPGDLKFGFQSAVTHDRIYLAPYRHTNSDLKEGFNNESFKGAANGPDYVFEIWEFDWDGNMLNKYSLSHPLNGFKVAPDGRIWGISEDEEFNQIIVRYEMPL